MDKLYEACKTGDLDRVIICIKNGDNIHAKDDLALQWAAEYGHLEVVKYLVKIGVNIHVRDDHALRYAASNNHIEVVKYLVENNADIHAFDDLALQWAAYNNHIEVVLYLIECSYGLISGVECSMYSEKSINEITDFNGKTKELWLKYGGSGCFTKKAF